MPFTTLLVGGSLNSFHVTKDAICIWADAFSVWSSSKSCKTVAGGRRPPERLPTDRQHPERGARGAGSARTKAGTPSGCDPITPLPEVFASLRPPATLWQPSRVAKYISLNWCLRGFHSALPYRLSEPLFLLGRLFPPMRAQPTQC